MNTYTQKHENTEFFEVEAELSQQPDLNSKTSADLCILDVASRIKPKFFIIDKLAFKFDIGFHKKEIEYKNKFRRRLLFEFRVYTNEEKRDVAYSLPNVKNLEDLTICLLESTYIQPFPEIREGWEQFLWHCSKENVILGRSQHENRIWFSEMMNMINDIVKKITIPVLFQP